MAPQREADFRPVGIEAAAGVVARIRPTAEERWNVELRLVPTAAALPQEVRETARREYGNDHPQGVLYKGVMYLVADQHGSTDELEATILHEPIAIRRLTGGGSAADLNPACALLKHSRTARCWPVLEGRIG